MPEARRLVRDGAIGKVAFARVRSSHGGPASGAWPADPTWFYQKGSGPLFDMGVYGIHEITGILGPAKRVVAFAGITEPTRTVRGGPFKGKKIDVTADDNVLMMLDFGGSTFAVVDGTFNVNAARGPKLEIFGREGTINIAGRPYGGEGPPLEIFRLDAAPGSGLDRAGAAETRRTMRRLRAAPGRSRRSPRGLPRDRSAAGAEPEHARHVLEIMLKADESARTGQAHRADHDLLAAGVEMIGGRWLYSSGRCSRWRVRTSPAYCGSSVRSGTRASRPSDCTDVGPQLSGRSSTTSGSSCAVHMRRSRPGRSRRGSWTSRRSSARRCWRGASKPDEFATEEGSRVAPSA